MMRQWRLIYDTPTTGARNMAVDEAILSAVSRGAALPTLRFYAWSPPCLSLGYAQKTDDINRVRLDALGWEAVRRPTGGRAILHADELTYSLALPADDAITTGGIVESYRRISSALVAGLEHLGTSVESARRDERAGALGAVCFEVPSHYELTVNGRKLVGSAQMRRSGGILQHGSLPLRGNVERICDALVYEDEATREAAKASVRARAITLAEALGSAELTWEHAARTLAGAFASTFSVELIEAPLSDDEQDDAARLERNVYSSIERRVRVAE